MADADAAAADDFASRLSTFPLVEEMRNATRGWEMNGGLKGEGGKCGGGDGCGGGRGDAV